MIKLNRGCCAISCNIAFVTSSVPFSAAYSMCTLQLSRCKAYAGCSVQQIANWRDTPLQPYKGSTSAAHDMHAVCMRAQLWVASLLGLQTALDVMRNSRHFMLGHMSDGIASLEHTAESPFCQHLCVQLLANAACALLCIAAHSNDHTSCQCAADHACN